MIKDLYEKLISTGLPVAYNAFTEKEIEEKNIRLPFICYRNDRDDNMAADDSVYYAAKHYVIELYEKHRSEDYEGRIQNVLDCYYTKTEAYLNDEACFIITYEV